jgi:hypothetical protein
VKETHTHQWQNGQRKRKIKTLETVNVGAGRLEIYSRAADRKAVSKTNNPRPVTATAAATTTTNNPKETQHAISFDWTESQQKKNKMKKNGPRPTHFVCRKKVQK